MNENLNLPVALGGNLTSYFENALDAVLDYKEMLLAYDCAIKEIRTKFDILDSEFKIRHSRNPISSISTRLKSNASLMNKVSKLGVSSDVESIKEHIEDIAGVRVICNYIDDIYKIADSLVKQSDIKVLKKKDYIANPKPNGYRSLHLIITVPVFFEAGMQEVKVEVQIRTIAMDFWASLEHQMRYKKTELDSAGHIIDELTFCAEIISQTDIKMQKIREDIEQLQSENREEESLLEKLQRINISLL